MEETNMQLTDKEKEMVARLKYQQKKWPIIRWMMLAISFLVIGLHVVGYTNERAFFAIGIYIMSLAINWWHGRPESSLLLRLVEAKAPHQEVKPV